jgi:hypothetical protein
MREYDAEINIDRLKGLRSCLVTIRTARGLWGFNIGHNYSGSFVKLTAMTVNDNAVNADTEKVCMNNSCKRKKTARC